MSVRGLVERLIGLGVDAVDAAEFVVEAMLAGASAAPGRTAETARQARNRRYYENGRLKASESKTDKTVSDDLDAPLEEKVSPTPPSKTQSPTPPSPPKGGSSPTISVAKPNGFARFWEAYPLKVGKRTAEAAFGRAVKRITAPDSLAAILAGLDRCKRSRKWSDPDFVPHPTTWLNRDGWEDEPEPRQTAPIGPAEPVTDAERARRLRHYRDTGEWRDAWGEKPERAAA